MVQYNYKFDLILFLAWSAISNLIIFIFISNIQKALRIALSSIESNANKYGRYIVPLLSISVDYYIRLFVQVFYGKTEVNRSAR